MMKSTVASLLFLGQQSSAGSTWDYNHMSEWSQGFPMCGVANQSPIDIKPYEAVFDKSVCDSSFQWDVDFTQTTFQISNNGHAIALTPVEETNIDPDMELSSTLQDSDGAEYEPLTSNENTIARLKNYFKPDSSDHDTFCLHSFHFHWGQSDDDGSEHFVDGNQYPLEVHFVHYSCEHPDLTATLEQFQTLEDVTDARAAGDDTHQLGVVGIFFDVVDGMRNPAFDAIFTNETMDGVMYPAESGDDAVIVKGLFLDDLIPEDVWASGYYSYEGSLTTPPCTDIVRWHVMNARSYIGREQMEFFRDIMSNEEDPVGPNYREIQTNPSTVYGCTGTYTEPASEESEEVIAESSEDSSSSMSWWGVAIISSLATAVVMGAIFLFVYNQSEREEEERTEMGKKATSASSDVYGADMM